MKRTRLIALLGLVALLPITTAAKDKRDRSASRVESPTETAVRTSANEPWISVKAAISDNERTVIREYVQGYTTGKGHGRRAKQLPPGLAKKVARGEKLPPGWERKCAPGQVLPPEVYERTHPMPPELVVKLPPPPPDTITVTIGGKIVRLAKATREILDVFDVHVQL